MLKESASPSLGYDPYFGLFVALFLLIFGVTNKTLTMSTAETSRMAAIESMVLYQTQSIDHSYFLELTNDFILREGKHYSDKPPIFAFFGALVYGILYKIFNLAYTLRGGWAHYWIKWFLTGLPLLALGTIFYLQFRSELQSARKAFLFTCLGTFGTLLMPYATVLNNHSTSASFYGIALYFLWKKQAYYFWAGFFFAFACTLDFSGFIVSLPLGIWLLFQRISLRKWLYFWIGVSLPLGIHAILNIPITGDFKPGAMHLEYFSWMAPEARKYLTGGLAWNHFGDYCWYLFHMLVGHRGFFLHCPLVLFGAWECFKTVKNPEISKSERGIAFSFLVSMFLLILYYSTCSRRFGDYCYSIRWFLLFLPPFLFYLPQFYQKKSNLFIFCSLIWIMMVTLPAFHNPFVNKTYHSFSFIYNSVQILKDLQFLH